jgi:hypothetical protein
MNIYTLAVILALCATAVWISSDYFKANREAGRDTESTTDQPVSNIESLILKEYLVPPGFINVAQLEEAGDSIRTLLESQGVLFPPGASAIFLASSGSLVVRNTQDNLNLIDALVDGATETTSSQEQISAPEMTLSEDDKANIWLKTHPTLAPSSVTLVEARKFPIVVQNVVRGSTTVQAGARAEVTAWDDDTVTAVFAGNPQRVPKASTDFMQQVSKILKNEELLDLIIIPHISITDLTAREAIAVIQQEAEKHSAITDGEEKRLNFELTLDVNSAAMLITMDLKQTPLREVLDYFCRLFDLQFQVSGGGILIGPRQKEVE